MTLSMLAGPVVGAVIGYFTNYIAVKMLFRPRKEIRVFGHRLPLTPGAIPKGKPRLAKAVGAVVAGTLVTGDDIEKQLVNEDAENLMAGKIMSYLSLSLPDAVGNITGDPDTVPKMEERASAALTTAILSASAQVNWGDLFEEKGPAMISEKMQGSFQGNLLGMFLNDQMLGSLSRSASEEVQRFIADNGRELLEQKILEQLRSLESQSLLDLLGDGNIDRCLVRRSIISLYEDAVHVGITKGMERLNLAGMVEDKINAMSVEELEKLVFAVMKNELNAIVNLGALIGFVLGLVMLFVK